MVSRNPSELARRDSMLADLQFCRKSLKEGHHSKATKEYLIKSIRELERQLELEHIPYNSGEF